MGAFNPMGPMAGGAPLQSAGANPQAAAPTPSAPVANPLQEMLGKIAILARQLGVQNTMIQPEMQQISQLAIQGLQKISQASSGPAQPLAAPPQM
jgi:hypothetical protein